MTRLKYLTTRTTTLDTTRYTIFLFFSTEYVGVVYSRSSPFPFIERSEEHTCNCVGCAMTISGLDTWRCLGWTDRMDGTGFALVGVLCIPTCFCFYFAVGFCDRGDEV